MLCVFVRAVEPTQQTILIQSLLSGFKDPKETQSNAETQRSQRSEPVMTANLEQQLQPKLNMSRFAGGADHAECWRSQKVIRQIEVRVIEQIKELRSKLKIHLLS